MDSYKLGCCTNKILLLISLIIIAQPCFSVILAPVSGRSISESEILPADVLARVELLRADLDLIRLELGKPAFPFNRTRVLDTAPREVYFMASALYAKADRLAFEYVKTSEESIETIDATSIRPYHVWQKVNKSYERIQAVKAKLQIPEKSLEKIRVLSTSPSDVIQAMIKANQELGTLLSQKVSAADVYQQVTRAININAQLLASFKNTVRIPDPPKFQRRKTPENVYRILAKCFELVREIAQISNQNILRFDSESLYSGATKLDDVYSLATLLVAELSYFHALRSNVGSPANAYYPGSKTPSHVFQRVRILELQLKALRDISKSNPNWLKASNES